MFVIRKVGQRKTLSDQQKTLSSQFQSKKNLIWFSGKCFPLVVFVFRKVVSEKSLSKLSYVCLPLGKLVNEKHFPVKEKFSLIFRKVFSLSCVCFPGSGFWKITFQTFLCLFVIRKVDQWKTLSSKTKIWLGFQESVFLKNLGGKHFPEVVKNLEMLLFADYIKFDPQTFNCYIYFVLNIYFLISSLKILFLY